MEIITKLKRTIKENKMIFKYEGEEVEYSTEELLKLEDGETIAIDFNGKYMIEFRKDEKLGALVTTGRGMDGRGSPIGVDRLEVVIEDD